MIRVLIVGYGPMGLALTRGLLNCSPNILIVGVLPWSNHIGIEKQPYDDSEHQFRLFLEREHLSILNVNSVNSFAFVQALETLRPDIVLVGSWGEILQPHILACPGIRFINCHPSLLPKHRGSNPYTAAILMGETETGISFHVMDSGIDTGPILFQKSLPLTAIETGYSLRQRCAALAEEMLPELLQITQDPSQQAVAQSADASYDRWVSDIYWIDWSQSPEEIERAIRAFYPWFHTQTLLDKHIIRFRLGTLVATPESLALTIEPGSILQRKQQQVLVSTIDPKWCLRLYNVDIPPWPALVSSLLARIVLRPGKQFSSPKESPLG